MDSNGKVTLLIKGADILGHLLLQKNLLKFYTVSLHGTIR